LQPGAVGAGLAPGSYADLKLPRAGVSLAGACTGALTNRRDRIHSLLPLPSAVRLRSPADNMALQRAFGRTPLGVIRSALVCCGWRPAAESADRHPVKRGGGMRLLGVGPFSLDRLQPMRR